MKTTLASLAVLAGVLCVGAASAQPAPMDMPGAAPSSPPALSGKLGRGRFARMDKDGDGKVTREEFIAFSDRMFDRIDANHTGQITKADLDAFQAKQEAVEAGRMMRAKGGGAGAEHEDKRLDKLSERLAGGGALTRQQWEAISARRFDRMDAAHQGYLTPDAFQKANPAPGA